MTFLELAQRRYSSRDYQLKEIEPEKLTYVLEAARIAPSAANKQPWHFIVIRDAENRKKVAECYHRDWFGKAPVMIIACGDHSKVWKRVSDGKDHTDIDLSIAIDHMTLAATDCGLATCWICNFDVQKVKQLFNLPENIEPIALLPLAYPADKPNPERHSTARKNMDEIVHWEKF